MSTINSNYTALALVVDRSGSMSPFASDVKGGVRQFIKEQKEGTGRASLTLAQFDHEYDLVYDCKDIQQIDSNKFADEYKPRGSTALLDAIGRTTLSLQAQLKNMPAEEQPKRVVVAIFTDGLENSSKEFNLAQIKELIKEREAAGWDFMFMGATLETIEIAKTMGFSADKTAYYDTDNIRCCMDSFSQKSTQARLDESIKFSYQERQNLAKK